MRDTITKYHDELVIDSDMISLSKCPVSFNKARNGLGRVLNDLK